MYLNQFKKSLFFLVLLVFQYVICRYLFFDLHGMKDIPFLLFDISIVTMVIAVYNHLKITSISSVIGYILWFFIAFIFQSNGLDEGMGMTNNFWIIWLVGYIGTIVISLCLDLKRKV